MNSETFKKLRGIMNDRKLSEGELSRMSSVPQPTINRMLSGVTKEPKRQNLRKIADALGMTIDQMLGVDGVSEESATYSAGHQFSLVPMVEQFYHAGNGDGLSHKKDPEFLKSLSFRRDWLEYEGFDPAKLKVAMVHGKSMEPTLNEANVILIDRSDCHVKAIESGKIYALTVNGSPLVKRVYRQELGGLTLESDNASFKEISITESSYSTIEIIGRVVWSGGKVG